MATVFDELGERVVRPVWGDVDCKDLISRVMRHERLRDAVAQALFRR